MLAIVALTVAARVAPLHIDGLVCAVISPFDSHSELDVSAIQSQADFLNATGVGWLFVAGTTGESVKMSVDERKQLLEAWIASSPHFGIIAHVGAESIKDARALAVHAQGAGADAIGAMPPSFFKPANADMLAATIAAICAAAPKLPCYYYHIPSMDNVRVNMLDFVKAIEPLSSNFVGIKYTGMYDAPGMFGAQEVMEYKGGLFEVLSGREEMMVEALAIGIRGFVGSQFNIAGDLFNSIHAKFTADGITKASLPALVRQQARGLALIKAWTLAGPDRNGLKYFARRAGMRVGDARLPNLPLDTATTRALNESYAAYCGGDGKGLQMCKSGRQ